MRELVAANDDGNQTGHLGDSACKERLERGKSGVESRVDELRLSMSWFYQFRSPEEAA
jgi:creatinine amidohydrolase/Fe(II)-dependent formamide hydrolase-like protein